MKVESRKYLTSISFYSRFSAHLIFNASSPPMLSAFIPLSKALIEEWFAWLHFPYLALIVRRGWIADGLYLSGHLNLPSHYSSFNLLMKQLSLSLIDTLKTKIKYNIWKQSYAMKFILIILCDTCYIFIVSKVDNVHPYHWFINKCNFPCRFAQKCIKTDFKHYNNKTLRKTKNQNTKRRICLILDDVILTVHWVRWGLLWVSILYTDRALGAHLQFSPVPSY